MALLHDGRNARQYTACEFHSGDDVTGVHVTHDTGVHELPFDSACRLMVTDTFRTCCEEASSEFT